MSAVHGNAHTIIVDGCNDKTIVLTDKIQIIPILPLHPAKSEFKMDQTIIAQQFTDGDVTQIHHGTRILDLNNVDSAGYTRIAIPNNDGMATILKPHIESTVVGFGDKTRLVQTPRHKLINEESFSEASNDLLTRFDVTKHSNCVGILAARELFEKALKDKGKILSKRFVLESVLGFGGMGVVYLTKDLRRVEAEDPFPYIATKVLNDDFKNHPDAFVALQQEAVKSQMLSHPNIVTVHDFDRDSNTLYMTMELLRGNPLDKLIKQNYDHGMPVHEAVSIFDGLCEGLSCAHRNKLIHSDLKPMNIFITFGQVAKILDFGIARVYSDNDVNISKFDAGNLGAITPEYASLEMIKKKEPKFSDDIYALACIFYLTLSGKHPYNRMPANKALRKKMEPARIKSLSNSQWKALEKGLALESKDRFQSVDEFKKAFHHTPRFTLAQYIGISIVGISMSVAGLALGLA